MIIPDGGGEIQKALDAVWSNDEKFQTTKQQMIELLKKALVNPAPGEPQQPDDQAWSTLQAFDAARCAGGDCTDLKRDMMLLGMISRDSSDMSCADARLLNDIMTRPVGPKAPSLEDYLAGKVEAGLDLYMPILPNPDFRTFNSIQPGLATSTLDYNSVCRTLLLKGAMHLIGIPVSTTHVDVQPSAAQLDRTARLERTLFSFPKRPLDGVEKLKLSDFDAMIDPLDNLDVYESSGPQMP